MGNMNFGVNLLPQTTDTYTLGANDKKWNLYVNNINGSNYNEELNNIKQILGAPASNLEETTNWTQVKRIVKAGLGPTIYPIGTTFSHYQIIDATISVNSISTGITAASFSNKDTFINSMPHTRDPILQIEYDGSFWRAYGLIIDLSYAGISVTGTPATGDLIDIKFTRTPTTWQVVDYDHFNILKDSIIDYVTGEETIGNYTINNSTYKLATNSTVTRGIIVDLTAASGSVKITKKRTSRFIISEFSVLPDNNVTGLNYNDISSTSTEYTLTLNSETKYLVIIFYHTTNDAAMDIDLVKNSIHVKSIPTVIAPSDPTYEHTMVLKHACSYANASKYLSIQYCPRMAFYYNQGGAMGAGTYYFKISTTMGSWTSGNYYFTTTQSHPTYAQFCIDINNTAALTTGKVYIYDTTGADTASEICNIASGTGSGTLIATMSSSYMQQWYYGSNIYGISTVRQWLTSDKGSNWQEPTTYLSRPLRTEAIPSLNVGFLYGQGYDFINALETVELPCRTNNGNAPTDVIDGSSYTTTSTYILYDKAFILSCKEIFDYAQSDNLLDGSQLTYYQNENNSIIDITETGTAIGCFTRTPSTTYTLNIKNNAGERITNNMYPTNQYRIIPVVVI